MKLILPRFLLILGLLLAPFLSGCGGGGGFSESTPSTGGGGAGGSTPTEPQVFLAGQVVFGGIPAASVSTVHIAASVSQVPGAAIDIFHADDLLFTRSLLNPGEQILAASDGRYAILKSQMRSEALSATLVIRAKFANSALATLVQLSNSGQAVSQPLTISPASDALVRFLQEEAGKKIARPQTSAEIQAAPWLEDLKSLARTLAERRDQYLDLVRNQLVFNAADHDETLALENRRGGAKFQNALEAISQNDQKVSQLLRLAEQTRTVAMQANLGTTKEISTSQRALQLMKLSLQAGYFVLDPAGRIYCLNRYHKLEGSEAPSVSLSATSAMILASFSGDVTSADLEFIRLPAQLLSFIPQELTLLKTQGAGFDELVTNIARDALRYPWITTRMLQHLATLNPKDMLSLKATVNSIAAFATHQRQPVERVQRSLASGGFIVPGEPVAVAAEFGGPNPLPERLLQAMQAVPLQGDRDTALQNILNRRELFLGGLSSVLRLKHHQINQAGQSLATPGVVYPDPLSELSTRFMVQANINQVRTYGSRAAERQMELAGYALLSLKSLWESKGSTTATTVPDSLLLNLNEILTTVSLTPALATMMSTGLGYFQDLPAIGGQTPRVENYSLAKIGPLVSESIFRSILTSAGRDPGFVSLQPQLVQISQSLQALQVTTVNFLRTIPSGASNRKIKGRILISEPGDTVIPAARFLVSVRSLAGTTVFNVQSQADGTYEVAGLVGDSVVQIQVELKDVVNGSVSGTQVVTAVLQTYLSGYEDEVQVEDFYLLPALRRLATSTVTGFSQVTPANALPQIRIRSVPSLTSGTVALSLEICDEESNSVDIRFGFTSGETALITTSAPRIALTSVGAISFPPSGILTGLTGVPSARCSTEPRTVYWHSRQDLGLGGLLGTRSQRDVRVNFSVRETGRTTLFDTAVFSNLFDLDNEAPTVTFVSPLPTDPETTKTSLNVIGKAADLSTVSSIVVSNISLRSNSNTTWAAINLGAGFSDWQANNVLVESGIENTLHVYATDQFQNTNQSPYVLKFKALDAQPPAMQVTSILVTGGRNVPVLTGVAGLAPVTVVTSAVGNAIRYDLFGSSVQSVSFDLLTTGSIQISGLLTDISGVNTVRLNSTGFDAFTTNNVEYSFVRSLDLVTEAVPYSAQSTTLRVVVSALDKKNNDSRTTNFADTLKNLFNFRIFVQALDVSPPVVAVLEPTASGGATTLKTSTVPIRITAIDDSLITTVILCTSLACQTAATSTDGTYRVTLPISERQANRVTGIVSDRFGFQRVFSDASPLLTLNLNDITAPSLILTSVLGQSGLSFLPLVASSFSADAPKTSIDVLEVRTCASPQSQVVSSCSVTLSGILSDLSGFDLTSDGRGNFSGFRLRMNSISGNQFNPALDSRAKLYGATDLSIVFANTGNASSLTAYPLATAVDASGVQTIVPFDAQIVLSDDGYWPLVVDLTDKSKTLFNPHTQNSLRRREFLYLKRDTVGPAISDVSIAQQAVLTSGKFLVAGNSADALSSITSILIANVPATMSQGPFNLSPWANLISLPSDSSRAFSATVTLPSGVQTLSVTSVDSFGNRSTTTVAVTVYPLYVQTLKAEAQFTDPFFVGFTGASFSNTIVADRGRQMAEVLDSRGEVIRTLLGDGTSVGSYSLLTNWITMDTFFGRQGSLNLEGLSLQGQFNRTGIEIVNTLTRFRSDGTQEGAVASLAHRTSVTAVEALTYPVGTLVRFAPVQRLEVFNAVNHVNFAWVPSQSPGQPRLFRHVASARDLSPTSYPSEGGLTASTASVGTGPGSTIASMVVTQFHQGGLGPADDPVQSFETVHLVETQTSLIHRYRYNNRNSNFGFTTLAPISLGAGVSPGAIEMDPDGQTLWVANKLNQQIIRYSMSSGTPVTVTSFGGLGLKPGQYMSIDYIRAYRTNGTGAVEKLYVVDSRAQRISVVSTSGVFEKYLGKNPYASGGYINPRLLGTGDNKVLVLDANLDSIDFVSALGEVEQRITTTDLSPLQLANFSPVIHLEQNTRVFESTANFLNPAYFTASNELYRRTTNSLFLVTENSLIRKNLTQSQMFTAVLTSGQRLVTTTIVSAAPVVTTYVQAAAAFSNLKGFSVTSDSEERYLFVEDLPGSDRVQMLSPDSNVSTQTNLTGQSGSIGICAMSSGVAVIGTAPAHLVQYFSFAPGTRQIPPSATFQSLPLLDYNTLSYPIGTPTAMACQGDFLAVAEAGRVGVFQLQPGLGFVKVQEVSASQSNTLTGTPKLGFASSSLFIVQPESGRLHRYTFRP